MCLAIPGKVKEVRGERLMVEYPMGNSQVEIRQALAGGIPLKIGDLVLIQMGIAIKVVTEKEARRSWKAWRSVSPLNNN